MPFPKQAIRKFTRADIDGLNKDQIGVYGLFKTNRWIYIGRGDIRERLLAHLNGDNPCITREGPTSWVGSVTSDHVAEEKRLIAEYNLVCNKKVG